MSKRASEPAIVRSARKLAAEVSSLRAQNAMLAESNAVLRGEIDHLSQENARILETVSGMRRMSACFAISGVIGSMIGTSFRSIQRSDEDG